jgi:Reverse transcriptase (RNA-dependent DNA polymerase)
LRECRYPDEWKLAKIVTLNKLKSGIPKCDQTRPISLLATHSKLFEKVLLQRVRHWAESNRLVPQEQSGFRPNCLLPTRVLSIYQEVKNNMAANVPTLAIYVDYQKAYDRVWHAALLFKLWRMGMPLDLLKMTENWLKDRKAYVAFGEKTSDIFDINIGLPQGSSLSPYLFIVFHCDLINCLGAHSGHIFADDLSVLIRPPIMKKLAPMIQYLENEGTRISNQLYTYSKKWKQPINISKTVAQLFHTQVERPVLNITMNEKKN